MSTPTVPLLEVEALRVDYGAVCALEGLSLQVHAGQVVALVGESGSGKSTAALSLPGLLPPTARVTGEARFRFSPSAPPCELISLPEAQRRALRGRHLGVVFQEPLSALNPVQRVGHQVAEVIRRHLHVTKHEALAQTQVLFERVGLPSPTEMLGRYPHELSGGQRQRVVIAQAIACNPALVVADEPTTALDPTVQRKVLELLVALQAEAGFGLLLVTHDLGIVAALAHQVVVLCRGQVVESGAPSQVFTQPSQPYTRQLVGLRRALEAADPRPTETRGPTAPLVSVRNLTVHYRRAGAARPALDDVSFELYPGETLGIVGESGSGKSTLASVLVGLQRPTRGTVAWAPAGPQPRARTVQLVFQDPFAALTPTYTLGQAFGEVLRVHGVRSRAERAERAAAAVRQVELPDDSLARYPHQFSGGQRQRLCIARALLLAPAVLVLDEALASLDASVQVSVLELLERIAGNRPIAYLFISHDLATVRRFCHRVGVLYQGKLVQLGTPTEVVGSAPAPYTQTLLAAEYRLATV
ncbi:MAG: ABC transporter ATP-binding protein [Bacteroidia bacterium]|nr:ABC transporter ATP-binding protein [Bacteroidia bacterium]